MMRPAGVGVAGPGATVNQVASVAWLLMALGAPHVGMAATFDCARAASSIEDVICGNRQLSALDEYLDDAFTAKLRATRDSETTPLIHEQRKWLSGRMEVCDIPLDPDQVTPSIGQKATACLIGLYRERLLQLGAASSRPAVAADETKAFQRNCELKGSEDGPPLIHPEFRGLDLVRTFPQLRRNEDKKVLPPTVSRVFMDDDGNVILRIGVPIAKYIQGGPVNKLFFDINIFNKIIKSVYSGDSPAVGFKEMLLSESGIIKTGKNTEIYQYNNGFGKVCSTPLYDYWIKRDSQEHFHLDEMWIVLKEEHPNGVMIGGKGCNPPTPEKRINPVAETGVSFIQLPDGTLLAWTPWATDVVRIGRNLCANYRSPQLLTFDRKAWRFIVTGHNDLEIEARLLSLFEIPHD